MAKPIQVIFPAYVSQTDVDNGFANVPGFASFSRMLPLAIEAAQIPNAQVSLKRYPMGDPALEAKLRLRPSDGSYNPSFLPQVLFSTPDPNSEKGIVVLAKLVGDQITQYNLKIMLEAVWRLKTKINSKGEAGFYDPSLRLPFDVGFNPNGAPGGYLLGLNPNSLKVELNRYGQMLEGLLDSLKDWWLPLAIGGAILLASKSRKKSQSR